MKRTMKILLPCVLTVAFLAAGFGLLLHCVRIVGEYSTGTQEAQTALENVNNAAAEEALQAADDLRGENDALELEIAGMEAENAAAEESLAALQDEYDQACMEEDKAYYLAIMESLREGMMQVEDEIERAG